MKIFCTALLAALVFCAPARAATIGGIEITGTAAHGREFPALEHYHDNVLLSGQVVNAFGVLGRLSLAPLGGFPIAFNQAGSVACNFQIRVPKFDTVAAPHLTLNYGNWVHDVLPWYSQDVGAAGSCDRTGLVLDLGAVVVTVPGLVHNYEDGVGKIFFAGAGVLAHNGLNYNATVFLTTLFDYDAWPYQLLIRLEDTPQPQGVPGLAAIPVPPMGACTGLLLACLTAGRRLSRRRAGPDSRGPRTSLRTG